MAEDIPANFYSNLKKRVLGHVSNKDGNSIGCWLWGGPKKNVGYYGIVHKLGYEVNKECCKSLPTYLKAVS